MTQPKGREKFLREESYSFRSPSAPKSTTLGVLWARNNAVLGRMLRNRGPGNSSTTAAPQSRLQSLGLHPDTKFIYLSASQHHSLLVHPKPDLGWQSPKCKHQSLPSLPNASSTWSHGELPTVGTCHHRHAPEHLLVGSYGYGAMAVLPRGSAWPGVVWPRPSLCPISCQASPCSLPSGLLFDPLTYPATFHEGAFKYTVSYGFNVLPFLLSYSAPLNFSLNATSSGKPSRIIPKYAKSSFFNFLEHNLALFKGTLALMIA